jgi:hydroxymethylpyrimidine/phosphomethylpyrimidine kinase
MPEKPPIVLTIAGFDPSSGAGVTADIKTIAAHACYGVACITALTVQSTSGVKRVRPLDPSLISDTLEELAADLDIAAVHIGMLGSAKVVKAVADFLSSQPGKGSRPGGKVPAAQYRARSHSQVLLRRGSA